MLNIGFLISHISKSDPHLFEALKLIQNAINPEIIQSSYIGSSADNTSVGIIPMDIPSTIITLDRRGVYLIFGIAKLYVNAPALGIFGSLCVAGVTQKKQILAELQTLGASVVDQLTGTFGQLWKYNNLSSKSEAKLQFNKGQNAGIATVYLQETTLTAVFIG